MVLSGNIASHSTERKGQVPKTWENTNNEFLSSHYFESPIKEDVNLRFESLWDKIFRFLPC